MSNRNGFKAEFNTKQTIRYLSLAEEKALREAGNFIRREYRKRVYSVVRRRTGSLYKNVTVMLKGKERRVQIGFSKKAFYGMFFETGRKKRGPDGIMSAIAKENAQKIRAGIEKTIGAAFQGKNPVQVGGVIETDGEVNG